MKNIFKKIAVVALAMIMCISAAVPVTFAEDAKCPGEGKTHTSGNCDYKVVAQNEASCEIGGFVTGQCNKCSATFVVNSTDELGHDWVAGDVSCLSATVKTCKRCGKEEAVPGSATGHAFGEWITKGDKGCFVGNRRYRVCSACGETEEETMKDAHSWVVVVYVEPVNCKAPGKATYVCENKDCGATKTAELWAKGEDANHSYRKWDSTESEVVALTKGKKDPNAATQSCIKDGARTEICIDCGDTKVIYSPASSYQHTLKDMKFVEATLDVNGCKGSFKAPVWECYYCGIMFKDLTSDSYEEIGVKETYYAKYGTISPVIKSADYNRLSDDEKAEYYDIYCEYGWRDYEYYETYDPDVVFVAGTHFKKVTAAETWWNYGHSGKTNVAATCLTPGYEEINCIKCGTYSFKNIEALGHVFYPEVTKEATQNTLKSGLGYSSSASTDKWADLGNVGKALGCGKIWNKVFLPTCTNSAAVEWRCLNKVGTQCTETKVTALSGSRNAPYGHDYKEVEVLAPTCLTAGLVDEVCSRPVQSYKFVDSAKVVSTEKVEGASEDKVCGSTVRKSVAALGHKWVKDTDNVENATVTCKDDGLQWYECANAGCAETKKEVVATTGAEHLWSFYAYSTPNTEPNCLNGVEGLAICTKCDMLEPQTVKKDALGHKYVEINDEAMKLLEKKGYELYVDADGKLYNEAAAGRVLAAEYIVEGTCTESAVYKVYCQREGCNITSISEPNKDKVKEKHNVVIVNYYYNLNGVYDANANDDYDDGNSVMTKTLDCVNKTFAYLWYCKDKNCSEYRVENLKLSSDSKWVDKNGNAATLNKFEFYGTHFNPETGAVITYKDVPDERISKADNLAAAQAVKAPVDENGNITAYAVEIPGTTLVWRYAIDEVSCDNDQVTVGGFYCVKCENSKYTAADKVVVGDTRVVHHDLKKGSSVPASCLAYGYTPYTCKNCDYTVQTAYEPKRDSHDIDLADPISVTKPTCDKTGAKVYQCQYNDCRQFVTVVDAALGHVNVSGQALLTSCLDPNANIENRRCKNCSQIIISAHNYVNGQCDECGAVKPE